MNAETQIAYALNQYQLCCEYLNIPQRHDLEGDTLLEALMALEKDRDEWKENRHLADGDNCTLKKLKDAYAKARKPPINTKQLMENESKSETPETDAVLIGGSHLYVSMCDPHVKADFARKLECQRNEAREQASTIKLPAVAISALFEGLATNQLNYMETFLKYTKTEIRRLRREHEKIVDAASFGPHQEMLRIEQESAEARLWLADEMERAAKIVRRAISTAKDLQENGSLS